jgi:phage regulator Rha-like protein
MGAGVAANFTNTAQCYTDCGYNQRVIAATVTNRSPKRFPFSALNGACGCMESGKPFGVFAFQQSGRSVTQRMGQCRGRTHVPMPLTGNPAAQRCTATAQNEQANRLFSVWPTKRVLANTNVTVLRVLGLQRAGQRLPNTYRSGVSGCPVGIPLVCARQCQCGGIIREHQLTGDRYAWTCGGCGRYQIFHGKQDLLTRSFVWAHNSLVSKEIGFDSLNGAVMSRLACESDGGFFTSGASSTAARTGKPQGLPVLHRSVNPVSGCHPFDSGMAVTKPLLEHHMEQSALDIGATTPALATPVSQTMSILEIAKLTGKKHFNVLRDIRNTLTEAGISLLSFEEQKPYGTKGRTREVFNLPRLECDLVISGYSVKYRLAIIKRWHELEAKVALPNTPYAVLPGQTLSAEQAATLRGMLGDACKALAKDLQPMFMQKGWAKLKTHFGVSYRQIPAQEFTEAVSLVSRHIVSFNDTKVLPAPSIKNRRWLISFNPIDGREQIEVIAEDAMVATWPQITDRVKHGDIPRELLLDLANTSGMALALRATEGSELGWGEQVARNITSRTNQSELRTIVTAATLELWRRGIDARMKDEARMKAIAA